MTRSCIVRHPQGNHLICKDPDQLAWGTLVRIFAGDEEQVAGWACSLISPHDYYRVEMKEAAPEQKFDGLWSIVGSFHQIQVARTPGISYNKM